MTELVFDGCSVQLHGRSVVQGVSFRIGPGELGILVGPNGAGKSTLLRSALGLATPSGGQVLIDGRHVARWSPRQRAGRIAWLAQQALVDEALRAEQWVAAARYRFDESHPASLRAAHHALERVGAGALAERWVTELSGGEQQRVALASLLAQQAPLLVLDEPANHLDPAQQVEVYRLLGKLWGEGQGILCVTHDVNLIGHLGRAAAARVLGLARGELQFDRPHDADELPADLTALFGVPMVTAPHAGRRLIAVAGSGV